MAEPIDRVPVALRQAEPGDALTLSALGIQVFLETYAPDGVRPDLAREAFALCSPEAIAAKLNGAAARFVLAEADSHVLGFAEHRLEPTPAPAGGAPGIELVRLYVQRAAHGRGLGAQLVRDVEHAAHTLGATHVWLTAWEKNTQALGFYRAAGLVDAGRSDYVFEGQRYGNRVFVKPVGGALAGAGQIQPRAVRAADLPRLNAIAWAAKAHWGYRHEQLEAWRADLEVDPHSLAARPVFVAEREGAAVGFVQLATDTEPWEIRALWIDPAHMRRGIGQALMRHACAVAAAAGQREIAIDADPNALGFYTACGARVVGQVAAPLPGDPGRTRPQLRIATAPYKDTARLDATALEDAAQPSLP